MKKKIFYLFSLMVGIISVQILLTASSNGRAFSAGSGNTGAPGESTTCRSCHGTGFNTTVSVAVLDSNNSPVTMYNPGQTYNVGFLVSATGASRYGFQLVVLNSSNSPVNGFSVPAPNTRLVTLGNGRQYAEHAGKSPTSAFGTQWIAPATGTGTVTFYGGGAAVNNNGDFSGDGGNTTTLSLTENTSVGLVERTLKDDFLIYPNPTRNVLKFENRSSDVQQAMLQIMDANGRLVESRPLNLSAGEKERINTSSFAAGIYYVKLTEGRKSYEEKIIIQ